MIYLFESVIWAMVSLFCETTDMTTLKSSPKITNNIKLISVNHFLPLMSFVMPITVT